MAFRYLSPTYHTLGVYSADGEAPGYPATNAAIITRPFRTWKQNATTDYLYITFPSAQTVNGIWLNAISLANGGVPHVTVDYSADLLSWNNNVTSVAVPYDSRVRRYKGIITLNAATRQYWRLRTTDGSITEIGAALLYNAWTEFDDAFDLPMQYTRRQATTTIPLLGGGSEIHEDGLPYLEHSVGSRVFRRVAGTMQSQLLTFFASSLDPILVFENRGDNAHAYLVRRLNTEPVVAEDITTFQSDLVLTEYI